MFNTTFESGYGNFGMSKGFHLDGLPDVNFKHSEVQLISTNGVLIGLANRYEPVYLHDPDQEIFDLQLVSINISKIENSEMFSFLKDDLYETSFVIKNLNKTYAFSGTLEIGDFGVMKRWMANRTGTIGPRWSVEVKGPIMTDEDLRDLRTELRYCSFC